MNWHNVGMALHLFMVNHALLVGNTIQFGAKVPIPDAKTVVLIRGPSKRRTNDPKSRPELTLFVECWEREVSEDEPPEDAYGLVADLEEKVFSVINEFGKGDQRINGKHIKVEIGVTEPDGDMFRPMIGSRTKVTILWQ